MKKIYKYLLILPAVLFFVQCQEVLEQDVYSSIEMNALYDSESAAEIGLTGCYNRFFNESAYSQLICYFQVSTDDIKQPSGWCFQLKDRTQLTANPSSGGGYNGSWAKMYEAVANVNLFLEKTAEIPDDKFSGNRKKEMLAEGHFLRGVTYYYLTMMWGDVPLVLELKTGGPEDNEIAKSTHQQVLEQVKADLTIAANDLPAVLENYADASETNLRKGRASKWAAKAYLARIAMYQGDLTTALALSEEVIASGLYPLAVKWRSIFDEPMNSSESIFEQQNDYSPGFFGSGLFGWFMGFDFEIADQVYDLFDTADELMVSQGKDIRWEFMYGDHPWSNNIAIRKHVPPRGYANGGIEQLNFVLIRATELYFNKYEILIEQDYESNKQAALDFLNTIRARAYDPDYENPFWDVPKGTTGIDALTLADVDTKEKMVQAIRDEKRREMIYEDGMRWFDLLRWDKEYAKQITNSATDNHLFLPIHEDELLRNDALEQNPAYQ
ncbi:RagB/SusD family nutrient uptake outer membrane protein [Sunxiuqinia indica]|uniref:RagB/SusD family nutrient uptake outer membrane protein n=1 Tax=Sunxiuqinia indica TaxID=2692584 RepID=UPI001359A31B|nr:RagB/SusD family nutrient uptake outer membrane protein [Sunxiuqinia indica]